MNRRVYSWLAVIAIVVAVIGDLVLVGFVILPRWQKREQLVLELIEAEQRLGEVPEPPMSQEELAAQLTAAQAQFDETVNFLLSESQAAELLDKLHRYASESGVVIAGVQPQSAPEEKKDAYDVSIFRLLAEGTVPQLIDFMSRIKEAAYGSFTITNVTITESATTATLTFDITLYTSPYSSGTAGQAAGNAPAATPIVPTQPVPTSTPIPTTEEQLTHRLDEAWEVEDWKEAIRLIEQLLTLHPNDKEMVEKLYAANVNYGYWLTAIGQSDEAKEAFSRALDINPNGTEAIAGLGELADNVHTPTPTSTPEFGYIIHVVRQSDTLYSIARQYNTTVQAIMTANGLTSYDVYVGQRLHIPVQR